MRFDPMTAIITVVAVPVFLYILKKLAAFLKQNAGVILDPILWIASRSLSREAARRIDLKRYCSKQLASAATKYLPVPGALGVSLETDRIFVTLSLDSRGSISDERAAKEMLRHESRLMITGDPGQGKSSLVKKLFREQCETARWRRDRGGQLPILVELKHFTPPERSADGQQPPTLKELTDWAMNQLRSAVTSVDGYDMQRLFDGYRVGRGLAVFLDGLDEVPGDKYPLVADAIHGMSKRLEGDSENNRILLTMRTQYFQQVASHFVGHFPRTLSIRQFSPADIYTFLQRWPFDREKDQNVSRIYKDLSDRPTLREMCANPLVLAMYVSNDQSMGMASIPDTRTSFYDKVVKELLVGRRDKQFSQPTITSLLEQRESILGKLALENLIDPTSASNVLAWSRAVDVVQEVIGTDHDTARLHFLELAKATGLVVEERREDTFRFIHLTFCEFLAAKECSQSNPDAWKDFIQTYGDFSASPSPQLRSRLNEVIPFLCALMPRDQRTSIIQSIHDSTTQDSTGTDVLGKCFLETRSYDLDLYRDYCTKESAALSAVRPDDWDNAWLRRLHLFNVVLRDAEEWARRLGRHAPSVSFHDVFRDLVRSSADRLVALFTAYAIEDAGAAFRLAEDSGLDLLVEHPDLIVRSLSEPAMLAIVRQRAESEVTRRPLWLDVMAEAGMSRKGVAEELGNYAVPDWLMAALPKNRHSRWYRNSKDLDFYLATLSVVASRGRRPDPHRTPLAHLLSFVPTPGGCVSRGLFRIGAAAALVLIGTFGWLVVWPVDLWIFGLYCAVAAYVWLAMACYPYWRDLAFAKISWQGGTSGYLLPLEYEMRSFWMRLRYWLSPGLLWLRLLSPTVVVACMTVDATRRSDFPIEIGFLRLRGPGSGRMKEIMQIVVPDKESNHDLWREVVARTLRYPGGLSGLAP